MKTVLEKKTFCQLTFQPGNNSGKPCELFLREKWEPWYRLHEMEEDWYKVLILVVNQVND